MQQCPHRKFSLDANGQAMKQTDNEAVQIGDFVIIRRRGNKRLSTADSI
jgi:hypothetical protein